MLTEPGVTYFIEQTLKQCHAIRMKHYHLFYNATLFIGFCLMVALFLVYKYKGKLTLEEMEERELQKKTYILSKIQNYQDAKIHSQQQLITGLPQWETEFDVLHSNIMK